MALRHCTLERKIGLAADSADAHGRSVVFRHRSRISRKSSIEESGRTSSLSSRYVASWLTPKTNIIQSPNDGDSGKQYAQKFFSDPDKHDGLYWKASAGESESPIGPLVASAATEGYVRDPNQKQQPFDGYY